MATVPIATQRMLWNRQLEQTCPACGWQEPAGLTCSKCAGEVRPADWHPGPRYGMAPTFQREPRTPTSPDGVRQGQNLTTAPPDQSTDQAQDPAS